MGGAREGVDRSVLPPILDKEGKLEKFERQGPTPENAGKNEIFSTNVSLIMKLLIILMFLIKAMISINNRGVVLFCLKCHGYKIRVKNPVLF